MDIARLCGEDVEVNFAPVRPPKRQKTRHNNYTIAWVCALYLEMTAAISMLDEEHDSLPMPNEDTNTYVLGRIKQHNIVIACLPLDEYGTNNAANVMANVTRSFPSIRAGLMVGIGGGAPSQADIRLGDIVVGTRVMQCDFGKIVRDGEIQRTAIPKLPPLFLRTALSALRAKQDRQKNNIPSIIKERFGENSEYCRPDSLDLLFPPTYDHVPSGCPGCTSCDHSKLVPRSKRATNEPHIHYGAMASGNQVMRSASQRDKIARELDIVCFEMEAAGLMGNFPCLCIRGICDYSDSHKSKTWQKYAAATAAAYATELLAILPGATPAWHHHVSELHVKKSLSNDYQQKLLETLKFDQLDSRQSSIKVAHAKTCRWLLKSRNYTAWRDPEKLKEHHGFLWIRGKPGSGKSTIMKYAYANMARACGKQALIACFFFNARGDELEKTMEGMYRSLLLQLLQSYPDLQSGLNATWTDTTVKDNSNHMSLDILRGSFRAAVLKLGKRHFTCFIDALDECDEQQIMDIVPSFEDLAEEAADEGIELRICFSSRHYPYLSLRNGIQLVLEDQPGHTQDLANYIQSRLRISDHSLSQELQTELLDKASGVFLWLVLVVDVLNTEYAQGGMALRKRLAEIPGSLHDLFRDMLKRDNTKREELRLCVLWILCAKRPLTPEEFRHALWAGLSPRGLADSELPDVSSASTDSTKTCVVGTSKGLAEITKAKQPTVQFIHESVRDFLLKSGGLQEVWPDLGYDWKIPSHEILKECCSAYLKNQLVRDPVLQLDLEAGNATTSDVSRRYPFLYYASQYSLYHADVAAEGIPQDKFLSGLVVTEWIRILNHFEKHSVRKYTTAASLLYILADKGCSKLIRTWLRDNPKTEIRGERYTLPFFAAVASGNKDSVAAILGLASMIHDGVDVLEGLSHKKDDTRLVGRTPFTWAAQEGRIGIVKFLLRWGANVMLADDQSRTALSRAAECGHEAVVSFLLQNGASLSVESVAEHKAFRQAAQNGQKTGVKLFLDLGLTPNTQYKWETALLRACRFGHKNVAELLIERGANVNNLSGHELVSLVEKNVAMAFFLFEKGADINATSNYFLDTALHSALKKKDTEIAQLLVEKGADIHKRNRYGETTLFRAFDNSLQKMVTLLVEKGADIKSSISGVSFSRISDQNGVALKDGDVELAKLLIEGGAELVDMLRNPLSPMDRAMRDEPKTVAALLLSNGVDLDAYNTEGKTALMVASYYEHEIGVRFLLKSGADPNRSGGDGMTALHEACRSFHDVKNMEIVTLLVEHGARVNAMSSSGKTPLAEIRSRGLAFASSPKEREIAYFLRHKGAEVLW